MRLASSASVTPAPRRYLLFGRVLPLLVFGFLLAVQGELLLGGLPALGGGGTAVLGLSKRFLTVVFLTMVLVIYTLRPPAARTNRNPGAVLAAFLGSFCLYVIPLLPNGSSPRVDLLLGGDLLLVAGLLLSVYSLAVLRSSFSLVPEARRLVTKGPYRWVRHPLYVGETVSGLGIIISALSPLNLTVFALYCTAQLTRAHFEEAVLRAEFADYGEWAKRTRRFIPFVY